MHWTEYVLIFLAIYAAGDIIASIYAAWFAEKVLEDEIEKE